MDIKEYDGLYYVTSCGRVWSYKNNMFLSQWITKKGYCAVNLWKNGVRKQVLVHRLVASTYIDNPNNMNQVNHKDEVKTHNWVKNLEWCTNKYNTTYSQGFKIKCVETGSTFDSIRECARCMNLDDRAIGKHIIGKGHAHVGGYHFELVKNNTGEMI